MGNYIGTAIYVHVHINLPLIPFIKEIEKILDLFIEKRNIISKRIKERQGKPTDEFNMEIIQSAIPQLEILRKDVLQEIQILPTHLRDKCQLEVFATILGVVGTIFGEFNAHQIENNKATLKDVRKRQQRQHLLVEITQLNTKHIETWKSPKRKLLTHSLTSSLTTQHCWIQEPKKFYSWPKDQPTLSTMQSNKNKTIDSQPH